MERWRRCSSCKEPLGFGAEYWACNVSTCNRGRTALVFCSVSCWDAHLAVVPHRESWAVERRAPSREQWEHEQAAATGSPKAERPAPRRILPPPAAATPDPLAHEVLIVTSKLKAYIRARSGMSTSDRCVDPLSDAVRELADRAIEKARAEGRKTVLDRDFD
ncbi:hypothetical protein KJ059_02795 [Myxococcota bacterium]|nr:hypothetical protein [Myxococcota bacterium]